MKGSEPHTGDWWHRHANNVSNDRPVRFDLFVRSLGAPVGTHGRRSSVLQRVDRLDRGGVVTSARVTVWGNSLCVSECCEHHPTVRSIRDRIASFREWSDGRGDVSLGFERRAVDSSITGECFEVVDLPTICLAVYVDSLLEGVFPVVIGGEEWTVRGYLDWFERARGTADHTLVADA